MKQAHLIRENKDELSQTKAIRPFRINSFRMKTSILSFVMLSLAFACGGDKQARLEVLKKQQDKLAQKIEQLEKEIAAGTDSSSLTPGTIVGVEEVAYKPFAHYVEVQGRLDGDDNVAIYPEAMGVVVDVYAKVGQSVRAGQMLARMNDASYVEQLRSLETNYDFAVETFTRVENLWKQDIGSEIQYLQAKATKESLEAQIASVKKQIEMMSIKSPINGSVEESLVKVGQAVSPQFPAFRVVNFSDIKIMADVAEAYTSRINTGDEVVVYLPDIDKEIKARVTFCSKYINPTNRTFTVEARFSSNAPGLKANMVSVLKIMDYSNPETVVLPMNIVQTDNKGEYVLVAVQENNTFVARKQAVKTGQVYNGLTEITTGLKSGDKVIMSGQQGLNEGEALRF